MTITDANRLTVQYLLKDATSIHTAIKRWHAWCDGLSEAKRAAGLYDADLHREDYERWIALSIQVEKTYLATHKKPPMPSKTRKARMYDDAYRAADLAGVEIPEGISDMEGVFQVLTSVAAVLAVS